MTQNKSSMLNWIDKNRIYILFTLVFLFMAAFAPNFFGLRNLTNVLRSSSMNILVAIGFTTVLITTELDLSIGSVLTLGAVFTIGFRGTFSYLPPETAWAIGFLIAVTAGVAVGLVNGLLVTKAKINSFIVTLGTMIMVQGLIYMYTDVSLSATTEADFALSDFLREPFSMDVRLITPRILISLIFVIVLHTVLTKTRTGKKIYMIGGIKETAWIAGVKTDNYIIGVFVASGLCAAIGGSLVSMEMSSAPVDLGVNSLMIALAATIIGGTSMAGGKGSVLKTAIAVLMLETLFNGLNRFRVGSEVKVFASGVILAAVVLYEAYAIYKHEKRKGQRAELLKELETAK